MSEESKPGEWQIEFYATRRGKSPVEDFLDGLPAPEQAKARNILQLLKEFGVLLGLPHARSVDTPNCANCAVGMSGSFTSLTPGDALSSCMVFTKNLGRPLLPKLPQPSGS